MFVLPILALPILIISTMTKPREMHYGILRGIVLFGALTVLACELLSLFSLYSFWPLTIYWLAVISITLILSRKSFYKNLLYAWKHRPTGFVWQEWLSIAVLGFLFITTFATILLYPPTANYDANVYHMPRVFYWLKNASVHNFPTTIVRQIAMGPLPSFFVAQFQALLYGNDALAGFVQWFAYLGNILCVAGISKQLGAGRKAQFYAAVLSATIPMAILQATTTQTDLFSSLWVLITIYFIVYFIKQKPEQKDGFEWAILAGLAAGMVVLSKLSGIATLAPFAIMFFLYYIRKNTIKTFIKYAVIVVTCVFVVCGGFFVRNAIEFNGDFLAISPVDMKTPKGQTVQERIVATAMNFSRNFTMNGKFVSQNINKGIRLLVKVLNVETLDGVSALSKVTSGGEVFDSSIVQNNEHNIATNPLHAVIIFVSFVLLLFSKTKKKTLAFAFCVANLCAYFLVCNSVLYSSSLSRYLLASSIAGMAVVPITFEDGEIKKRLFSVVISLIILFNAPVALFHSSQPLVINYDIPEDLKLYISRNNYLTQTRGDLRVNTIKGPYNNWDNVVYSRLIEKLKAFEKIGISIWGEYPIIYNLKDEKYDVQQLAETNTKFIPEAIVQGVSIYDQNTDIQSTIMFNNTQYSLDENCGGLLLYIKK